MILIQVDSTLLQRRRHDISQAEPEGTKSVEILSKYRNESHLICITEAVHFLVIAGI